MRNAIKNIKSLYEIEFDQTKLGFWRPLTWREIPIPQ